MRGKTLSTKAKPRLTMSFSKGNNLIYQPLNYMLFNLLYWMFSLSRLQWCFFFHFNVSFHIQSIHFNRCSVILLGSKWEGDSKRIVNRWAMCQSRMLPSSYPIKLQLTYTKYNKIACRRVDNPWQTVICGKSSEQLVYNYGDQITLGRS